MADGNPGKSESQVLSFLILRIFSTIKPRKMAAFMNAITWQAAWLRHRFKWDRVVVGYALTDVPERVLEIYGIPTGDLGHAQRVLERLRAQPEYQELRACCEGDREEDEMLLPAMEYKTSLRVIMEPRVKEARLDAERKRIERELAENARQRQELRGLQVQLAGARQRLNTARQGALSAPQRTQAQEVVALRSSSQEIARFEREVIAVEKRIARLPAEGILLSRESDFGNQLRQVEANLQLAQEEIKRGLVGIRVPDYFLNVTIKMKSDVVPQYIEQMKKLLEDFAWDFIAAGSKLPPPNALGPDNPETEIMHLWKFGDANDLYRQMVGLRESRRYSAITQLLTEPERQMLMCDWEALSKTKRTPQSRSESKEE